MERRDFIKFVGAGGASLVPVTSRASGAGGQPDGNGWAAGLAHVRRMGACTRESPKPRRGGVDSSVIPWGALFLSGWTES
jgi:hypothetical protein